jgi:hypothetical protein
MHTNVLTKAIFGSLTTALIAAAPLGAQSFTSDLRFGFMGSFTNPSGDLSKFTNMGAGGTFLTEKPWGDKTAARLRFEIATFGKNSDYDTSALSISLWGDWLYRFDTHDNGLFVLGGIGILSGHLVDDYDTESMNGFGISGGIGYNLNSNVGFEVKYIKSLSTKFYGENFAFDWIQASVSYRF